MRPLPPVGRSITDHAAIYSRIGGALSFWRGERFQGFGQMEPPSLMSTNLEMSKNIHRRQVDTGGTSGEH